MANRLIKSTAIVAVMTMLSRVLGFIRDIVLAIIFGAGPEFDAFVIAFKIPNFMRRLFGEGAFAQAFVPVLSQYRAQHSRDEVRAFINSMAGTLGSALLVVTIIGELLAPWIVTVFAPGFLHDPQRFHDATHMLHITFPYLLLIALTAFSGAILNTYNRFAIPAFTPVLLNVAMIIVAWWWAPHSRYPIYTLAWGVVFGGIVQLSIQLPFLYRLRLLPRPRLSWRNQGVRRVIALMVPALFGVSVAQLSLLIDNFFASFLPAGSISWLYYSDRLTYLPLGVVGVAISTVVLPNLSRQYHSQASEAYSATLDWALRIALLIGVPAAIGLFILAGPLLATLIHHGAFNNRDVVMTEKSLRAFALGLPAFMLVKILASGFYSRQNIKTPVKVAALALIVNLVLNLALIVPLQHAGLALSTSIASTFNAMLLLLLMMRQQIFKPQSGWLILVLRLVLANVVMAWLISWYAGSLQQWLAWALWPRIWQLCIVVVLGVVSYIVVLWVVGLRLRHCRPPTVSE